ncbi:DUF2970 domain-containing protein [Psychrosphaera algicola]|uniref:DUF2970 domain-containing protein n=1 Tax=Psychrosphaera algicola TaxID=3023714 RepID=A0ABT5FEM5_9GAMM|nr:MULTISPECIES: DUF2970 domain-containing protein [unclassified Psychrosphaera]MDC2889072.1 DUF2970 domain-containing protein [Psychrosphaera sp. G1-22]
MKSAASAMIGIQKSDKHSSDFNSDTPFPFILAGVILVIGFILALITIVNFVVG